MSERAMTQRGKTIEVTFTPTHDATLQRKCACGRPVVAGGECAACRQKRLERERQGALQRRAVTDVGPHLAPPIVHDVLRSPGRPLDPAARAFMEPRFGHDFSGVHVHTDSRAAASARAVNAHAYTVGSDIVFGANQYAPVSAAGKRLLAHELTHVMQQGESSMRGQQHLPLAAPESGYEREADSVAHQVVGGNDARPQRRRPAGVIQRTMICSKRLEAPGIGLLANHAYIDDTGQDDCQGAGVVGNYAVTDLLSGNFIRGCATKTDSSPDPRGRTPNMKPCRPKEGVTDLSQCLRDAFNSYAEPSVYSNEAVTAGAAVGGVAGGAAGGFLGGLVGGVAGAVGGAYLGAKAASGANGPNSNTFAATLARTCCADASDSGLGWVPGWDHAPATTCTP